MECKLPMLTNYKENKLDHNAISINSSHKYESPSYYYPIFCISFGRVEVDTTGPLHAIDFLERCYDYSFMNDLNKRDYFP